MPEVIIYGPEGRLECRYMPAEAADAPTALILHPEPDNGGTMNNRVTSAWYQHFQSRGFAVMRLIFVVWAAARASTTMARASFRMRHRHGLVAVADPASNQCWIAGFSFGSWIGMQLMMRRPEIRGFISVTPPAARMIFVPCAVLASGLIIHGEEDASVPPETVHKLVERLSIQKGVEIEVDIVPVQIISSPTISIR